MGFTAVGIMSLILNIILLVVITRLMISYFEQKKQIKNLVKELDSESLEHYLNQIRKKGFDVSVKPLKKTK